MGWDMVFEKIPKQDIIERIAVDGGWLYRTVIIAGATTKSAGQVAVAMAFVAEEQEEEAPAEPEPEPRAEVIITTE